jgi:hypothetical protein
MEQPLKKFSYGPEAVDYLRCRLREDGSPLSELILGLDLVHEGQATAELPSSTDPEKLYKFRTDIFWGWPDDTGSEIIERILDSIESFLRDRDYRILLAGAWAHTNPAETVKSAIGLNCLSTRYGLDQHVIWFLAGPVASKDRVRDFLSQINRVPLVLADLTDEPSLMGAVRNAGELSEQQLRTLARNTAHVIVDVYDGRANLVWSRMSQSELRAKWEAGNVEVA